MSDTSFAIPDLVDNMFLPLPKLSLSWRIVNSGMALFFLMAAYANANDGDWYIWMPLYFLPSVLCFMAAFWPEAIGKYLWRAAMAVVFGSSIVLALYQVASIITMENKITSNPLVHKEGREMGGLLIILAWSGIMRFSPLGSAGQKQSHQNIMAGLFWVALALAVVPILAWSLCFVGDMHLKIGHCKDMFGP